MLGVGVVAAVVDDEPVGGGAAGVGVSTVGGAGFVYLRQEGFDGFGDCVGAVEGAKHAWFVAGVVEFAFCFVGFGIFWRDARPGSDVLPGVVAVEVVVGVECVLFAADVGLVVAVGECRGPVEESFWFECGGVEPCESGVDVLGYAPGDGAVFIGGDVALQPYPYAPSGVVCGVAECGVCEPRVGDGVGEVVGKVDVFGDVVEV